MNIVADESVEREIFDRLRADGHDTVYVAELSPSITDDDVLAESNARVGLLVTGDKDFGELVTVSGGSTPGSSSSAWPGCRGRSGGGGFGGRTRPRA